jgi:hypothetical protein
MLPEPIPPRWNDLQRRARSSKDPAELSGIIEEMNALLAEYEAKHGRGTSLR